jgi:hypothetical protein
MLTTTYVLAILESSQVAALVNRIEMFVLGIDCKSSPKSISVKGRHGMSTPTPRNTNTTKSGGHSATLSTPSAHATNQQAATTNKSDAGANPIPLYIASGILGSLFHLY